MNRQVKADITQLILCSGTGCVSNRSFRVKEVLEKEMAKHGLQDKVVVQMGGCSGLCGVGPVMAVVPDGIFYQRLTVEEIPSLVEEHFLKGRPVERLLFSPPAEEEPVPRMMDVGFFGQQTLIVLKNRGILDPEKIDEYIAR